MEDVKSWGQKDNVSHLVRSNREQEGRWVRRRKVLKALTSLLSSPNLGHLSAPRVTMGTGRWTRIIYDHNFSST